MIDGKNYQHHRLAGLYTHGRFPPADLDHRAGDPANTRLRNLREATRSENCQNAALKSNNSTGQTGVWPVGNRWRARLTVNGKHHHLGYFSDKKDADAAYLDAKTRHHEFQPVPRELIT
jgi:hypothetical protein